MENQEENLIIYKNKGEVFNCHLEIDGASKNDIELRLCLEFSNNKNLFFLGSIEENGSCSFNIPKLKEIENSDAKLVIEAITDSTYFKLYEAKVELKNSVEIKLSNTTNEHVDPVAKIILNKMSQKTITEDKPVKRKGLRSFKEFNGK